MSIRKTVDDSTLHALWTLPNNTEGFRALCTYVEDQKAEVQARFDDLARATVINPDVRTNALILKGHVQSLELFQQFLETLKAKIKT